MVVKVLCYKSEGRWFYPSCCQCIFHWHKLIPIALWPWGRLSLYQKWVPGVFPGDKGGRCVKLTILQPFCAVVTKSGKLNFLEPSGPVQACNGTACFTVELWLYVTKKNQLDATSYFIVLLIGSTCFGHYYVHHQELTTIMLITTLVVSFLVCCRLEGCIPDTTPTWPHLTSNLQQTKNETTNVVISIIVVSYWW